jgi:hypothetical protein
MRGVTDVSARETGPYGARARGRRDVRGVARVASVASARTYTEGDMRKALAIVAGASLLVLVYGVGAFRGREETGAAVAGWALLAGGVLGALVAAGHVRERRAWSDWMEVRAKVRAARRGWMAAAGVSGKRLALLGLLAGVAWYVWGR